MTHSPLTSRLRVSAIAQGIAAVLFVLYPAIRPFSDEASLKGAAAFASTEWLVAHTLAIVAFTLLPLGLLGLHSSLQETAVERLAYWAVVLSIIGAGLTLPFYGGETYGLYAIGQETLRQQNADLIGLAAVVRSGAGLVMFVLGLLLLAAAAITVAIALWRSGTYSKWTGIPFAVGVALYIPQFYGTQPVRVAHGLLVAIGGLWIAAALWSRGRRE
jgi:hypothetical protein